MIEKQVLLTSKAILNSKKKAVRKFMMNKKTK